MKNQVSLKLTVLILILISTLPLSIGISMSVLSKLQSDAEAVNNIGYIRGSSQRLVKDISYGYKNKIIREVEEKFDHIDQEYLIQNQPYLNENDFSSHYDQLKNYWHSLKKSVLKKEVSTDEILTLSEQNWESANALANAAQEISTIKYDESMLIFFAIGSFIFALLIFTIIVISSEVKNKLEIHVVQDALTKLYNRTHLLKSVQDNIKAFKRLQHPFSLIFIDIDHFKSINDKYGHSLGDKILIDFANLLTKTLRSEDIAFRYGGEEFVILANHANAATAYVLAERIRKKVEKHDFNTAFSITISLGIAQFEKGYSLDDIINHADNMMYKAKSQGRNRTCIYQYDDSDSTLFTNE